MTDTIRRTAGSVPADVVWRLLESALQEQSRRAQSEGRASLDILDAGGGTGNLAVPIAELGHRVTVVDSSPDSLAALERRSAEAGLGHVINGIQGDVAGLLDVVAAESVDVVVCHSVLEFVEEPANALAAAAAVLRPGGVLSLLVANRDAVVLAKAAAGHVEEATTALTDPAGRFGAADPMPRRYDLNEVRTLLAGAGLVPEVERGVRIFTDLVPSTLSDQPEELDALLKLEQAASEHPAFRGVAARLHIVARAPRGG